MGGLGSGGYAPRLGSRRLVVENVASTTTRDLLHMLCVTDRRNSAALCGIRLSTTRQPTGGTRWWMHCPRCGRRCGVLYQPRAADLACRRCHRLVYRSQRLCTTRRLQYRAAKLYARIGCNRDEPFHWRPKGMHVRTFERILSAAEAYDDEAINHSLGNWLSARGFI